jgi:hypothetical protein
MALLKYFRVLSFFVIALTFTACSNNGKSENTTIAIEDAKKPNAILPGNCDKIVKDYDDLVARSMEFVTAQLEGKEVDKAEQDKIAKESQDLAERISKLGITGLGGQHCYDEFVAIQQKWAQAGLELQQKAMEKMQDAMKQHEGQ